MHVLVDIFSDTRHLNACNLFRIDLSGEYSGLNLGGEYRGKSDCIERFQVLSAISVKVLALFVNLMIATRLTQKRVPVKAEIGTTYRDQCIRLALSCEQCYQAGI